MLGVLANQSGSNGAAGHVILRDGTPMAYSESGTGPVTIVLVHGWAASGAFFNALREALSHDFRVIAPDLRAHGVTPAGSEPLTLPTLADDLHELLVALDLRTVILLGWSMGAMTVWSMLERHGNDRVAGMIVEDMSPRILNGDGWTLGMSNGMNAASSDRAMAAMRAGWPAYAAAFAPQMFARDRARNEPELVETALEQFGLREADAMADLWESMAQQDLRPALPAMHLPALVTYGEKSEAYGPETSRYLVEALPQAERKGFARSGHAPHLEQPQEFAQTVIDFAQRVQGAADSSQSSEGSIS